MNTKWTQGSKKADKLRSHAASAGKSDVFSALDGYNTAAYKAVYGSDEFIASRMNLDKADEKRKALTRISEATARGVSLSDAIDKERKNDPTGKILDWGKMDAIKKSDDMNAFIKMRDDNAKAVAGMEKVHESIRKQYQADAATEDQLKFVKYNPTDPTDPSRSYDKSVLSSVSPEPEQPNVDNQNLNDQSSTTNSESTESPDIDTSTNTENVEDSSFEPIYRDIDEQLQAGYEEYAQYDDIIGTKPAVGFNSTEERKKQIEEQISKLVTEFDSLGNSEADNIRKEEIRKIIAELEKEL